MHLLVYTFTGIASRHQRTRTQGQVVSLIPIWGNDSTLFSCEQSTDERTSLKAMRDDQKIAYLKIYVNCYRLYLSILRNIVLL